MREIGDDKLSGFTYYKPGTYTQAGSGAFGVNSEKFRYTFQKLNGDGEIISRVSMLENTGNSSRVGVMIRESLASNARHVFLGLSGKGTFLHIERKTTGGKNATSRQGIGRVPNTWLRLLRKGNVITAYKSTNGRKWIMVARVELKLRRNGYIGLVTASGSNTKLNISLFGNVKARP